MIYRSTVLYCLLVAAISSDAQPGALDPTFNPSDIGFGYGDGATGQGTSLVLPNGQILLITGQSYNSEPVSGLIRLNPDGTRDQTFPAGDPLGGSSLALQNDGRIIVGGPVGVVNGVQLNRIARLHPDGSLDTSFDPGMGFSGPVGPFINSIVIQDDGRIVVGGRFSTFNGVARNGIVRLNSNGSLDTSFNPGTGIDGVQGNCWVNQVLLQSDQKMVIVGEFDSYDGTSRGNLARLESNGELDGSFAQGAGAWTGSLRSAVMQDDGRIIIGGWFELYDGIPCGNIARLYSDGTFDPSFDAGTGVEGTPIALALEDNGRVILGGSFTHYNGIESKNLARIDSNGSYDASYATGSGTNLPVNSVAVMNNGRILVGGSFVRYNDLRMKSILITLPDGTVDSTFNLGTGANDGPVQTIAVQSNGKLLIGGGFAKYSGVSRNGIARVNPDGTLDETFETGLGTGIGAATGTIHTIAVQPNGQCLIGGGFSHYNGLPQPRLARLQSNGALDESFDIGTSADNSVLKILVQDNGKIIIAGGFTLYNGTARNRITRLNADGSLDASFDPGIGANGAILVAALQDDGKILIGGEFTYYNGVSRNHIARVNPDGSLDNSFAVGSGLAGNNPVVRAITVLENGQILVGGSFNAYNGTARTSIVRLDSDGTLDPAFGVEAFAVSGVHSMAVQADGRIIIGGFLALIEGTTTWYHLARLNPNGAVDASFNTGTGPQAQLTSVALEPNGAILIGGWFTSYDGIGRNRIARLHGGAVGVNEIARAADLSFYPNPATDQVTIDLTELGSNADTKTLSLYDEAGLLIEEKLSAQSMVTWNLDKLPAGIYLIQVRCEKMVVEGRLVVQ